MIQYGLSSLKQTVQSVSRTNLKKDGSNLGINIKKKKKLLKFEPVELVVPRLEEAKKDA